MSLSGAGDYCEAHRGDDDNPNRHPWHPPRPSSGDPIAEGKLLMRNTLTGRKEPFVPMKDRHVRWYTCGPTVYDSAHVGHARTYLSFDIMRRIMTDYFHYNVLYQVNTTDIDDKIILRARQNVLIERLREDDAVDFAALSALAETALAEARVKAEERKAQLERDLAEAIFSSDSRARSECEDLLEQHARKTRNLDDEEAAMRLAVADPSAAGRDGLIAAARSVLAEKLDREKGSTVTDHAVFNGHARRYEREFMEDMDLLNIRPPDVLTRVTEYIPQIITFVEKIIDNGSAYESNGSVYLSLDAFRAAGHDYRKLSPAASGQDTSAAELAEGEGALGGSGSSEKRSPNDFALWKASKGGEPAWESPWGPGRPGWHIECSVVASDVLGERLDIHSGGEDLKFPHHDNELAQSEACLGCQQWVNYFTHTGHLHIEGLKMSKSLKNFITIRQALENNTARQLRIMFLLQGWDQPMNYSDQTIDDARSKEATLRSFFREVEALTRGDYLAEEVGWRMGDPDRNLADAFLAVQQSVHESLLDNFNTKGAMVAILKVVGEVNIYLRQPAVKPAVLLLRSIAVYVTQILRVFGVVEGTDDFGFGTGASAAGGAASSEAVAEPFIDVLVAFRERVRDEALAAAKKGGDGDGQAAAIRAILRTCDELRDETLPTVGVRLEDRTGGTRWNREDPEVMMQELAEKKAREDEVRAAKLEKKLVAKGKELEKIKTSMVRPEDMFKTDEFKEWDESGVPTVLADGNPVSGGQIKKKKKVLDKQTKVYSDLLAKTNNNPQELLDATQREVDDIKDQLSKLSH